jgi:hypothetical protein
MAIKTRKQYTSKGQGVCVSKETRKAMKRARTPLDILIIKQNAYLAGKNPWITVENPNKNERNKKFIRVRANDYWGNPKNKRGFMFGYKGDE